MTTKRLAIILVAVILILCVVALIVQQTRDGSTQTTGRLYCPECAADGITINLWQNGAANRGRVVAQGQHNATVQVLSKRYDSTESRYYYRVRVTATGATGWVPETLIRVP